MKSKKPLPLDEALKLCYEEKPLNIDLAATVAAKVFDKKPQRVFALDDLLYGLAGFITLASIVYCGVVFGQQSFSFLLLVLMVAGGFGWLAVKEYKHFSKKLFSYQA